MKRLLARLTESLYRLAGDALHAQARQARRKGDVDAAHRLDVLAAACVRRECRAHLGGRR